MKSDLTICVNCKNHGLKDMDENWSSHVCLAPEYKEIPKVNPVTGNAETKAPPYCRDINKGHCELFKEKSGHTTK